MQIKNKLDELDLNPDNSIVIGSGILNALKLRESKDIDLVVPEAKYKELAKSGDFKKELNHGREVLTGDLFEIGMDWQVVGKSWSFDDLFGQSTVIDDVRYNTVEFLLSVKRSWLTGGEARQKDIADIKLMENHLKNREK